jgi:cytoskeletal protein RodZ
MLRGIEIDQISDVTKVSATFLLSIEEDEYDELPASVYVRGFLTAYARAIGLDARKVAASYMARFEASKKGPRKNRLLGRR